MTGFLQLVAQILTPTAAIAGVVFVARFAIRHMFARDLEAYKANLSASSAREIESLKAELRRIAHEHDVVFERLHADRAEITKNLFEKVRSLSKAAKEYAIREGVTTAEHHEANRKAVENAANNLNQAMLDARIFLSENLCAKIQGHMHAVIAFATNIAGEFLVFGERSPQQQQFATVLKNKKDLEEAAWTLETEIATEFRKIYGID